MQPQAPENAEPKYDSALLNAAQQGKAKIGAVFGGQGTNNLTSLADLHDLMQRHGSTSVLRTLIANSSKLLSALSSRPHKSGFHEYAGFDLQNWLDDPTQAPPPENLALSPISFPINTLLSLARYCITCDALSLHPGQFRQLLRGVTGHSQGLFAAVAIAKSDSWASFYPACDEALQISFSVGLESHCAATPCTISAGAAADCIEHGEGAPSWMLSISGLDKQRITQLIEATNKSFGDDSRQAVHLALHNSRDKFILAGPPTSLRSVCLRLRQIKAPDNLDQTRVLSHKRKPAVDVHFLPISAPYHSPYLADIDVCVRENISSLEVPVTGADLAIPVYHTHTSEPLSSNNDLVDTLIRAVTVEPVDWPRTIQALLSSSSTTGQTTHILDFGPGQIGKLVAELTDGVGVRVIQLSSNSNPSAETEGGLGGMGELLSPSLSHMLPAPSWKDQFSPRLVQGERGAVRVETKMTRVFGTPPVMVAGMTPTTVPVDFVAAVMAAGYHVELAGGGYWEEKEFEAAIRRLAGGISRLGTGTGVTVNLLYANPRTIAWQVAVLRRLAQEGVLVEGLTIGAGVPSPEVVREYVEGIPGLRHISFKPGSLAAIGQVIAIAREHPEFPIGLQWTGGRAGGHHSWEDFHQPILAMYGRIRRCENIVLIAGSGFGGGEDTLPFLTGEWAYRFGYPAMPFDGVLLGSRMMVAKEAHTSPHAKELILKAPGVDDTEWHQSFDRPTGGVITVESEMGQPIHVLATRGMMLWKEFDRRIFSIKDKEKRLEYLRLHRDEIADRLNRDFFRPWFAVDDSGNNVELADMTYAGVLRRLCRLMYVHHQHRWIDESYRTLVHSFVHLAEARFARSISISKAEGRPDVFTQAFEQSLGSAAHEILYPEDISSLLALFRRRGQKPVPFIPQLDEHFETWFKKDSLWQSEDVDAVVEQDADRVCIIQGPVAVRYSTTGDESAKSILDSICQTHVRMLQERVQKTEPASSVQRKADGHVSQIRGLHITSDGITTRYELSKDFSSTDWDSFTQHIIGAVGDWFETCLMGKWIFRGSSRVKNPIRAAFAAAPGDVVEVRRRTPGCLPNRVIVMSGSRSVLEIAVDEHQKALTVTLSPLPPGQPQIQFVLVLRSGRERCSIFEEPSEHVERVKALYSQLWIGGPFSSSNVAGLSSEFCGDEVVLSEEKVDAYMDVVRRNSPGQLQGWKPRGTVPLDYCVVVAWTALTKPLMIRALNFNLLQLLHRSIRFRYLPSATPLQFGDAVRAFSRITALTIKPSGTFIQVSADIRRRGERVVTIETEFFIRGAAGGSEKQFSSVEEPELVVTATTPVMTALLISRKWLIFEEQSPDLLGKSLSFRLTTHTMFNSDGDIALLQVSGIVALPSQDGASPPIRLGRVYFEEESCSGNPVLDFLRRHGAPRTVRQPLENPGWTGPSSIIVHAPPSSAPYATVSLDTNPIHMCPVFARYAGLDGPVVHGMHTSALVRRAVEWSLGDADRTRFRGWQSSFEAMVRHNDRLRVELQHVAMEAGRMVFKVQAFNDQTAERVLDAEAEVEQAPTGYVFCGQGSQEKGMGMALYAARAEATALWDRAETYFREHYGFSILHIVRDNPKTLTIHFGGKRGRHIRDNYLAMTSQVTLPGGLSKEEPVLRGLTSKSKSYTFSYPKGLLMSTQFSQPALAIMDMAEYAHLQARGVVQAGAPFAGHSLGEYAALGACTSFMAFESLLSLIYYRGLKMQNALPRDADGRTDYGMVAVDPSRIGAEFGETQLQTLVQLIAEETGLLLEVVNYNILGQQYVCAGHYRSLWLLSQLSNALSSHPHPHALPPSHLRTIIQDLLSTPAYVNLSNTDPALSERGKATVPLAGIDIPFHSAALRSHIDDYRSWLARHVRVEDVKPAELVGRWIPNVVGEVFGVGRGFVERVAQVTESEVLRGLLEEMDDGEQK
ncbi:acyl transferase domain-containing protein [Achaetomium macrosporum]|uniref:Acyl transferase domain-containing protein n=1 Tax=Achaetomium macrosporum TaxID=79813 RepID=A0AAN7H888_9PEZI|nr:acyl transferase domain-containing protein [Achaetomium macrosporum]